MEKVSIFIQLTSECAEKITVVRNGSLSFFLHTDEPVHGKKPYSDVVEKQIYEKFNVHVAVTKGARILVKRATIYMKCKKHGAKLTCWIPIEDFKENSSLKFTIEPQCITCFPESSFAGKIFMWFKALFIKDVQEDK